MSSHLPIDIRPDVRGGDPVIRGTRITTEEALRFVRNDRWNYELIAQAYGVDIDALRDAVAYELEQERSRGAG